MTILMVLEREFPPDIRVENEINALTNAGFEVHIACYTMQGRNQYEYINNTHIHRKPISTIVYKSSVGSIKFPFYFNFWRKFLDYLLKKNHYDFIHIHDLPLAQLGFEIKSKYKMPFILDLHENWPAYLRITPHTQSLVGKFLSNNKQWIEYEKEYCVKADKIIVVIEEAKNRLINIGIDPKKIEIISNTLNLNHFITSNEHPDPEYFTMLYEGGVNIHRGLQYVISSLNKISIKDKKLRFWIVGTGSYIKDLKQLAKENKVENLVDFFGWKPLKEIPRLIEKSDVCIIPHLKSDHTDSTIPHKLFQYMYINKPIIASNCNPIERIINETESGLIYTYNDTKDFAEKVMILATNKKLFSKQQSTGKKAVEDKYNWEKDSKRLINIYKTI